MCVQSNLKKKKFYRSSVIYLLMVMFGIFAGLSDVPALQGLGLLISEIFIKIFKCISLPIIALSIIVTLSNYNPLESMKKIWQRTILYTFATTLIAATVSVILYLLIHPSNVQSELQAPALTTDKPIQYSEHIVNLIPANIFSPFLEHQVLGVLLVGMIIGIAIRYIPDSEARKTVTQFFKGAHGIFLVITNWVVIIIPVGLFGFITTTVLQLRDNLDFKGIGEYLAIVILANLCQGFIILPLWLKYNKIKPYKTMHAMLPALSVAFFSKSSAGTLPITIDTAEKNLKINPKISRLILPLCTTINMNGCAAFIATTVLYLMQNQGTEITLGLAAIWVIIATIAAVGNAGVPMGCFFLSASLLASMNVPITLLGIILPFYSIIDMVETALNVWSDVCVTTVVNEKADLNHAILDPAAPSLEHAHLEPTD